MRNLHDITPSEINFWMDKEGIQIPFRELNIRHIDNILSRYAASYVKGALTGNREKMFEGVILERLRRFGRVRF